MSRLMAFVDGENLTTRFQDMVNEGRKPRTSPSPQWEFLPETEYQENKYVWSPATVRNLFSDESLLRVHFYTTFPGPPNEADALTEEIARLVAQPLRDNDIYPAVQLRLIPRVFQKQKRNTKAKSVDINICVDVMEYTGRNSLDAVYLVTGDIDYAPLIEAVMRAGKRVYVAALSSGLATRLRYGTDRFIDLDKTYFEQ